MKSSKKSKKLPVTLFPETQVALDRLMKKYGESAAAIIRMCLWQRAQRDGLVDPEDFDLKR